MKILMPLLGLLFLVPSYADEIYKWVDDEGQVNYSDTPHDGATEVVIAPAQTFSLPATAATASQSGTQDTSTETSEPVSYQSMQISSPTQEETIWNTGGQINVAIQLQPGLLTGHRIVVYLDGQQQANLPSRSSSLSLSEVSRGQHQLTTQVQNENGTVLISSDPVTFFYQQTSVNRRR